MNTSHPPKLSFVKREASKRRLNIHPEVDNIGDKLRVGLRLIESAHNSESDARVALAHERGNNRVQRPLVPGERVGRFRVEIEQAAAILQHRIRRQPGLTRIPRSCFG